MAFTHVAQVAPGRTWAMPTNMASRVTVTRRRASTEGSPMKNILLVSPW
jgi:hypothetical protein